MLFSLAQSAGFSWGSEAPKMLQLPGYPDSRSTAFLKNVERKIVQFPYAFCPFVSSIFNAFLQNAHILPIIYSIIADECANSKRKSHYLQFFNHFFKDFFQC